jgi:hypothetical protein
MNVPTHRARRKLLYTVLVIHVVVLLYKWQAHRFGVISIVLNDCLVHYVTVNPKPSCIIIRGFGMVLELVAFDLSLFRYGIWIWNDSDDVYADDVAQVVSAWRDGDMSNTFTPHVAEVNSTHTHTNKMQTKQVTVGVFRHLPLDCSGTASSILRLDEKNTDES